MKTVESLELYSNLYKSLDIYSNLHMDTIMKNATAIENMGIRYDKIFNNKIGSVARYSETIKNFQDNYDKILRPYSKVIESMKTDYMSNISGALEVMQNIPVLELSSSMEAWQSSMKSISNDILKSYNNMIQNSVQDLVSGIATLDYSNLDFSSLRVPRVDDFTVEWNHVRESESEYRLENKIDLQEVEAIVNTKIEDVKLITKEQNGDIIFAINKLTEAIIESGEKENIKDNIVSSVISEIVVKLLFWLIPLMISFGIPNANTPVATSNNHIVKTVKKEIKVMDLNSDFYNSFRIVAKDGLEVRCSSKMKSGIKYHLNFKDLVKIEYKNKNWTKISYTNVFTGEREMGWVLTRYIKRLD